MSALEDKIAAAVKNTAKVQGETDGPYGAVRKYITEDDVIIVQNPTTFIMDRVAMFKDGYVVEVQYCNDGSAVVNLIQKQGFKDVKGDCFFQNGDDAYAAGLKMLRDELSSSMVGSRS